MSELLQVVTTTGDRAVAERIAAELVDRRLAACVHISGPITSTYHWQGKIETDEEWACAAKTTADRFAQIEAVIAKLHPYDVPELIATPIVAASESYGDWLRSTLEGGD